MKKFEVEKYINDVKTFFIENPNELHNLIGDLDENIFYQMIEEISSKNYIDDGIVELTQKQFIDVVVKMHEDIGVKTKILEIGDLFQKTKFGLICLN